MKFRIQRSLNESVMLVPDESEPTGYRGEEILPLFKVHFVSFVAENNDSDLRLTIQ